MLEPRESETIESSTVKETQVTSKTTTQDSPTEANMKSCLSFALLALVAALLISSEVHAQEMCRQESCVTPDKCEYESVGPQCTRKGDTCCGVVKREYRTHCHHFGGECMNRCSTQLQERAVDCPANTVCCVLV